MSKVTKRELEQRIEALEEFATYADNMITKLNHALPSDKPQLKTLDQSVFNGLDEKWRFAAVDRSDECWIYTGNPVRDGIYWSVTEHIGSSIGTGYDASNWQNSLIERDKVELTGSDLCRAMLERGDKWVVCRLADTNDRDAISNGRPILVTKFDDGFYHKEADQYWHYAVPINNQGEPLTASEVGL